MWSGVSADTAHTCFRKAGIFNRSLGVFYPVAPEKSDPFADSDNKMRILMKRHKVNSTA